MWKQAKNRIPDLDFDSIEQKCPALEHQIKRSYVSGNNIQSAVFSECVYAHTYAKMLNLNIYVNCAEDASFIPNDVKNLLKSHNLYPRYVYSNQEKSRLLVQAGGCGGIDCALITLPDLKIYTIEFKEPGAKTSEPDLPKYKEDGKILITDEFKQANPQFTSMLEEQAELNFFKVMGSNVNDFSNESVNIAVSNNYTKKYADVICTEDKNGYLTMLPANQVSIWADIQGEIRPAGRNHYKVWTPVALKNFLCNYSAKFNGDLVSVDKTLLAERRARGGNHKLSGYKITPLFFIYVADCTQSGNVITFNINKVQQLNPTIAGKMFFKKLVHALVKAFYGF